MASGQTLAQFFPTDQERPASNGAVLALRNVHPVLLFDATTQESAVFTGMLPRNYAGGGITVTLVSTLASAITGTLGYDVAFERVGTTQDIDSDSFATANVATAATVPGTSGVPMFHSVAFTNGAEIDSLAVGEVFRLRVRRDVATDTAAGDSELLAVEFRET